jgi:hypothetical protein
MERRVADRDASPELTLSTDASDYGWGAAVEGTQLDARGYFSLEWPHRPIM